MIDAFRLAGEQLREIAEASDGGVQVHGETKRAGIYHQFEISVRFDGLKRTEDGLRVRAREAFWVIVRPTFPFDFPLVETQHTPGSPDSATSSGGDSFASTGVPPIGVQRAACTASSSAWTLGYVMPR